MKAPDFGTVYQTPHWTAIVIGEDEDDRASGRRPDWCTALVFDMTTIDLDEQIVALPKGLFEELEPIE